MTRKDFEALALALGRRRYMPEAKEAMGWTAGFDEAVEAVMDVCQMQNGRFNRATFNDIPSSCITCTTSLTSL